MGAITCPKCGRELSAFDKFCVFCGCPIQNLELDAPKEQTHPAPYSKTLQTVMSAPKKDQPDPAGSDQSFVSDSTDNFVTVSPPEPNGKKKPKKLLIICAVVAVVVIVAVVLIFLSHGSRKDKELADHSENNEIRNTEEMRYAGRFVSPPDQQIEGAYDQQLDRNGNNVLDCLENNDLETDTDGDGLSDYYELMRTVTDPLQADSDGNGVNDCEEDPDQDGLFNGLELNNHLNPLIADTDSDGLTDSEELNLYMTDPASADTDADGAEDGWEVQRGYNPLASDQKFEGNAGANDENVSVSAHLSAAGKTAASLTVQPVLHDPRIDRSIPGCISSAFEILADGEPGIVTVSFEFDPTLLADPEFQPVIYCLNEDMNTWYELETETKDHTAVAQTAHFSKYILLNKTIYDRYLESLVLLDPVKISEPEPDSNHDGINDYLTEKMCSGEIRTQSGTLVFGELSYAQVQANADTDGDGLLNGEEVIVSVPETVIPDDAVELNGHYYKAYDYGNTWGAANSFCISLGGHLATITSEEEQELVKSLVFAGSRNSYWLGGRGSNKVFGWITGEEWVCDYGRYNNNDKSGYEDSLMMYRLNNPMAGNERAGMWNDLHHDGVCGDEPFFGIHNFGFVCEWEPQKTDQFFANLESSPILKDTDSDGFEDPVDPTPFEADVFRSMQDYKKYYFGDVNTITIFIRQPVWNSRTVRTSDGPSANPYYVSGSNGHSFVGYDQTDGEYLYFGLYPREYDLNKLGDDFAYIGMILGVSTRGEICRENPRFTIGKSYIVSDEQIHKLQEYAENHDSYYDLMAYNCTTFAVKALQAAGINTHIREHNWFFEDNSYLGFANLVDVMTPGPNVYSFFYNYYSGYSPADAAEDIREAYSDYILCREYSLKDGSIAENAVEVCTR